MKSLPQHISSSSVDLAGKWCHPKPIRLKLVWLGWIDGNADRIRGQCHARGFEIHELKFLRKKQQRRPLSCFCLSSHTVCFDTISKIFSHPPVHIHGMPQRLCVRHWFQAVSDSEFIVFLGLSALLFIIETDGSDQTNKMRFGTFFKFKIRIGDDSSESSSTSCVMAVLQRRWIVLSFWDGNEQIEIRFDISIECASASVWTVLRKKFAAREIGVLSIPCMLIQVFSIKYLHTNMCTVAWKTKICLNINNSAKRRLFSTGCVLMHPKHFKHHFKYFYTWERAVLEPLVKALRKTLVCLKIFLACQVLLLNLLKTFFDLKFAHSLRWKHVLPFRRRLHAVNFISSVQNWAIGRYLNWASFVLPFNWRCCSFRVIWFVVC